MVDYEKITANFSITGDALPILGDVHRLPPGQGRSVVIKIYVKYHYERHHNHYQFPPIEQGNGSEALRHLGMLWNQKAISGEKHDRLEEAIHLAEIATRSAAG
jgi:hypothetical protein